MDNAVPDGRLADNITHFARALRRAGLPLGPGRVIEAAQAMAGIGFSDRQDFHDALHALFVQRPEERAVFDQVGETLLIVRLVERTSFDSQSERHPIRWAGIWAHEIAESVRERARPDGAVERDAILKCEAWPSRRGRLRSLSRHAHAENANDDNAPDTAGHESNEWLH